MYADKLVPEKSSFLHKYIIPTYVYMLNQINFVFSQESSKKWRVTVMRATFLEAAAVILSQETVLGMRYILKAFYKYNRIQSK